MSLPIAQRFWFVNRAMEEIGKTKGEKENVEPISGAMAGKQRPGSVPNKMKRF